MRFTIILITLSLIALNAYSYDPISDEMKETILKTGERVKVVGVADSHSLMVQPIGQKVFRIRLLGVKGLNDKLNRRLRLKVLRFIRRKVLGKYVYLMYEKRKEGNAKVLEAYVYYTKNINYLLNATLIRLGYTELSDNTSHWLYYEFRLLKEMAQSDHIGYWKSRKKDSKIEVLITKMKKTLFESPRQLAVLTAEIYQADNDKSRVNKVFKKYGIVNQQDLERYFESLSRFAHTYIFQKTLKDSTKAPTNEK
ncbi:MAG TPA: hypothetical protein ENI73_06280 [Spirochaetes bacterium]|nr:hypothetical protein [Spirochaetota bacterium]